MLQNFRGHLAVAGTILFLISAAYGLMLVARSRVSSDRMIDQLQTRFAGESARVPVSRPMFAIGGLACGFVVLIISGC